MCLASLCKRSTFHAPASSRFLSCLPDCLPACFDAKPVSFSPLSLSLSVGARLARSTSLHVMQSVPWRHKSLVPSITHSACGRRRLRSQQTRRHARSLVADKLLGSVVFVCVLLWSLRVSDNTSEMLSLTRVRRARVAHVAQMPGRREVRKMRTRDYAICARQVHTGGGGVNTTAAVACV